MCMRICLLDEDSGHTKSCENEFSVSGLEILLLLAVNGTIIGFETLTRETDKDSNQTRKCAIILTDPLQQTNEGCQ